MSVTMLQYLKFRGRLTRFGLIVALTVFIIDQSHKWAMIHHFKLARGDVIPLTPFLDLVLVWNKGISYGMLPQDTALGRTILLVLALATCIVLIIWLGRTNSRWVALALGLLIGGAVGNVLDRMIYGAVADFFSAHAFGFYWYVFNLADTAIVAGVALLLYDSLFRQNRAPCDEG